MKVTCSRCGKTIEYESTAPKECPVCKEIFLVPEKTADQKQSDGERLHLAVKLKTIPCVSKRRRFLLVPFALLDLSIPIGGFLLTHFFPSPIHLPLRLLFWLGLVLVLVGVYRMVYHSVMYPACKRAIVKENYRSVNSLITRLKLKTKSDVLVIVKRLINLGVLYNVSVERGEEIKVEKKHSN